MSNIIDSIQLSGVTYTLSAETSGGGITSGEVQTMIDTSISGKVNVSDNEVPPYYKTYKTGYWPESRNPVSFWVGLDAVKCQTNTFGSSNYGQIITIQVKDSSDNAYSGTSRVMSNKSHKTNPSYFLPSGMGDYLDVTFNIPETEWNTYKERYIVYTAKEGYKITYAEDFKGYDGNYYTAANIVAVGSNQIFEGGQSAYVIENAIEPKIETISDSLSAKTDTSAFTAYSASVETALSGKQDTLSAGTGIEISGNVISATGGGGTVSSAITSGDTNAVAGGAVYDKIDEVEQVTAAALNELNDKITPTVELTQAEYDALTVKDPNTYYIITDATPIDLTNYYTKTETNTLLGGKQATLVSGTNIKTINNESILGSGNIDIQGGSTYTAGRGISIANDTISFSLPISAGTSSNNLIIGESTNISNANRTIATGYKTKAQQSNAFAQGYQTDAGQENSHAEGYQTKAYGLNSHSEGRGTSAMTTGSHAEGFNTRANNNYEHSQGWYNVSSKASNTFGDSGNTLFSVGNGTADNARHNAFEIRQNGDIYLSLNGQDVKLQDQLGGSSITVDTALDSGSTNPVENRVIYNKIDEVEQVTAAGLNALNDALDGLKLKKLTQAEYDALTIKDASTLYIIID